MQVSISHRFSSKAARRRYSAMTPHRSKGGQAGAGIAQGFNEVQGCPKGALPKPGRGRGLAEGPLQAGLSLQSAAQMGSAEQHCGRVDADAQSEGVQAGVQLYPG